MVTSAAEQVGPVVTRMRPFGETISAEMSALATRHHAVNLGQGFPDTDGPAEMLAAAKDAIDAGRNQYPPGPGIPELLSAIAAHQKRFYDIDLDPAGQVLVTVGATEAIASVIMAFCEPGDEVILFEPYYDSYAASVALAGAVRRTVPLRFPDWELDESALRAAFTDRTRLILLNTPHNPTGKIFTRAEIDLICSLAREHDVLVVTDEVYEHLTFDGAEHLPVATLPGMFERTLTISSAAKTFSCTGWKVGWVTGSERNITAVRTVKQFLSYVASGPFQPAVALALGLGDDFYAGLRTGMAHQRDILVDGLSSVGLRLSKPSGTYFVIADAASLGARDSLDFCRSLPERAGVAAVPVQPFCDDTEAVRTLVRFAFCKRPEVLVEAVTRLRALA